MLVNEIIQEAKISRKDAEDVWSKSIQSRIDKPRQVTPSTVDAKKTHLIKAKAKTPVVGMSDKDYAKKNSLTIKVRDMIARAEKLAAQYDQVIPSAVIMLKQSSLPHYDYMLDPTDRNPDKRARAGMDFLNRLSAALEQFMKYPLRGTRDLELLSYELQELKQQIRTQREIMKP